MLTEMLEEKTLLTTTQCDWCGKESGKSLISVTLVTPRGAFRDEICEDCRHAYAATPEPA